MRVSELISKLQEAQAESGDRMTWCNTFCPVCDAEFDNHHVSEINFTEGKGFELLFERMD